MFCCGVLFFTVLRGGLAEQHDLSAIQFGQIESTIKGILTHMVDEPEVKFESFNKYKSHILY